MGGEALALVLQIAAETSGIHPSKLFPESAVVQDMGIAGGDVEDFADALANEFGAQIWEWPWQRFAVLDEGLGCFFLPGLFWQLFTWPFRGSFGYPDALERLTLGHIASVIEKGEWFEP
jgi:hypothetical protein